MSPAPLRYRAYTFMTTATRFLSPLGHIVEFLADNAEEVTMVIHCIEKVIEFLH